MDVFLDPDAGGSKTVALFEQIRDAITSGRLTHGDSLPPTRLLAEQLGVSRSTITTAYGRLNAEGYINGRTGAGSTVAYKLATTDTSGVGPAALVSTNRVGVNSSRWSLGGFDEREPTFDLRSGRPDPALFPLVTWRRVMSDALHQSPSGYGRSNGLPTLRRALAQWVHRSRAVRADADQVIVTSGAQQGIDLVARLLVQPGETIAVEEPGYPPVTSLFHALGANVAPVPVDSDGIQVEQLPEDTRLIYVTPSHQSPTGAVMSMKRRTALLKFAEARNIGIIEDDYDTEYRHKDRPLEPLYRLDRHGRVIYVGTFSKTLSPSLRLGFVILPPSLVDDAIAQRSLMDWQPPEASQAALHRFIVDGHLDRHLRRTRRQYSMRHKLVHDYLHRAAEEGLVLPTVPHSAGLHTTACLPSGMTEHDVSTEANRLGIALGNFEQCWQGTQAHQGLIIGFGAIATNELADALAGLNQVLRATRS